MICQARPGGLLWELTQAGSIHTHGYSSTLPHASHRGQCYQQACTVHAWICGGGEHPMWSSPHARS